MPSISRANLPGAGAPKIQFGTATDDNTKPIFWSRGDVMLPLRHVLKEQVSSMYGRVTKTRDGRFIDINIPLYGFWTNLSTLFPAYFLSGLPSQRMYGTTDNPVFIIARNGDQIVLKNARIIKVSNLKLAANQPIFSADITLRALIANNTAPSAANAFYTLSTGATYTEGDFPQSAFKSLTWTGAWGSRTGFTSILTQEGWTLEWEIKTTPDLVDGIGPVDMFTELFWARAGCIPVGPSLAQIDTAIDFQGTNAAVGADIFADVDDLVLTDGTSTLTILKAAMVESGLVFAPAKKRIGPTFWESTRLNFTAGAAPAIATVS